MTTKNETGGREQAQTTPALDPLMTPEDVGNFIQHCKKTVLEVVANEIPTIRINSRVIRFRRSDVEAWLAARTYTPASFRGQVQG